MKITTEKYEEYIKLKRWAKRQKILTASIKSNRLEDDIDKPIKRLVGMFALLECNPQWSCCGFDYKGQPFHKSHQYGAPYVVLEDNPKTRAYITFLSEDKELSKRWHSYSTNRNEGLLQIVIAGNNPNHWWSQDISCIHYPEESIVIISLLENFLLKYHDHMVDSVDLMDTNNLYQKLYENWQYPAKDKWTIYKKDIIK